MKQKDKEIRYKKEEKAVIDFSTARYYAEDVFFGIGVLKYLETQMDLPNQKVFAESDDEFAKMVQNTAKKAKKSSYSRIETSLKEINLIREYLLSLKEDLDKG
jgi:hypothetical protein